MGRALTLRFSPNTARPSSFACSIRKDDARPSESECAGRTTRFGIAIFQKPALDCCMVTVFTVHTIPEMAFASIRTSYFWTLTPSILWAPSNGAMHYLATELVGQVKI